MIAVRHATPAVGAAAITGPNWLCDSILRRVYRRAYTQVDGVMSVVDRERDTGRETTIPLAALFPIMKEQARV